MVKEMICKVRFLHKGLEQMKLILPGEIDIQINYKIIIKIPYNIDIIFYFF